MPMIWLSFCDPEKPKATQFLGACIVEVPGGTDLQMVEWAVRSAWRNGCNPGGEVASLQLPAEKEDFCRPHLNRLMDRAEAQNFGKPEPGKPAEDASESVKRRKRTLG